MPALTQPTATQGDPDLLWKALGCLNAVSKELRGEITLTDQRRDQQQDPPCRTLTTAHTLKVEVVSHERCDSKPARAIDGVLYVERLVSRFADGSAKRRGMHTGRFEWEGSGVLVRGFLHGMTNVGTHREPAFDPCQKCDAPGFMEGQLHGRVVKAKDDTLVGCAVTAAYRLAFDPSENFIDTPVTGTLEGVLVCAPKGAGDGPGAGRRR